MSKEHRKKIKESLAKRNRSERHFQWFGKLGVILGLAAVVLLFVDIISKGSGAFRATYIQLEIEYDPEVIGILDVNDTEEFIFANWQNLAKKSLRDLFPEVTKRGEKRKLNNLVSEGAGFDFRDQLTQRPSLWGTKETLWILADDDIDTYYKSWLDDNPFSARLTSEQIKWIDQLHSKGLITLKFNTKFFERGDSREPEQAGIKGALIGSFFTLILTLLMSFPMGVTAAIYLEEFAPKNKWTDLIEVNINNLAAVPSIIFGLLGLAIFINFFGIPRSIPVLGAIVLALMTLPTLIITSRAAIKSVPPSIREAALGVGASKFQTTLHHVLPLSLPGMLTGAIIGMARALGETAPLLMIGMVAFIVDIPEGFTDPATVLPVQIILWIDSPERAFVEKTSAAIIILLSFLMVMNFVAVYLRKRLERRW